MNREHKPVPKAVEHTASAVPFHDQTRIDHQVGREIVLLEKAGEDPTSGGVTDSKQIDFRFRYAPFGQIGAGFGAGGAFQGGAEGLLSQLMHGEDRRAQFRIGIGIFGALGQRDSTPLGELLEDFVEAEPLDLLHELEHVATLAAAKAFVKLVVCVNPERWSFFGMERAEAEVTLRGPHFFQTNVFAYDTDDVNRSFDLRREIQSPNNSAVSPAQESRLTPAPCHKITG